MKLNQSARALGRRGGQARAARLSPEERRRIAAAGGRARSQSLATAKRIMDNLRYAAAARTRARAITIGSNRFYVASPEDLLNLKEMARAAPGNAEDLACLRRLLRDQ